MFWLFLYWSSSVQNSSNHENCKIIHFLNLFSVHVTICQFSLEITSNLLIHFNDWFWEQMAASKSIHFFELLVSRSSALGPLVPQSQILSLLLTLGSGLHSLPSHLEFFCLALDLQLSLVPLLTFHWFVSF